MRTIYQQQIIEHYHQPHHSGKLGEFTHTTKILNAVCGDEVEIFLNVVDNKITDASFQGEGCAISQAAASMLMDKIIGQTVAEVQSTSESEMEAMLGVELGETRKQCAHLALQTVNKALDMSRNLGM